MGERLFQSTLPVGGATLPALPTSSPVSISIHAPRGGSDASRASKMSFCKPFQSTLPVGGATSGDAAVLDGLEISIHAPRGGSDALVDGAIELGTISIHAPRGGSDVRIFDDVRFTVQFQSTLPVGGATWTT